MPRDEIIKKYYSNTIRKSKMFTRGYNLIIHTEFRDFKFINMMLFYLYVFYTILVVKHADFSNGKCENYYILITHHIVKYYFLCINEKL